jgi:hypothetical protein
MAKIKRIIKRPPKYSPGQTGWFQLANFWWARGMTPEDVHKILEENWLEKGWTNYNHNMFKDPVMRYEFICFLGYANEYMVKRNITSFKKACVELAKKNDRFTAMTLDLLLVPNAVDVNRNKILMAPNTFAKLAVQWRVHLEERGYLNKEDRIEDQLIELEKDLKSQKLLKKKKKKKAKKK